MSYPNMSYCMNQNTLRGMWQVVDAMQEDGVDFLRDLSRDERDAFRELFEICGHFVDLAAELQEELDEQDKELHRRDVKRGLYPDT